VREQLYVLQRAGCLSHSDAQSKREQRITLWILVLEALASCCQRGLRLFHLTFLLRVESLRYEVIHDTRWNCAIPSALAACEALGNSFMKNTCYCLPLLGVLRWMSEMDSMEGMGWAPKWLLGDELGEGAAVGSRLLR